MVRGFRSRAGGVESGSGGSREVSDLEQVVDDGRPDTLVQTELVTLGAAAITAVAAKRIFFWGGGGRDNGAGKEREGERER